MLEIKNQAHFDRVVAFAEKKGLKAKLDEQLAHLRKFADPDENGRCKVVLGYDSAPASFSLAWYKRKEDGTYEYSMNGACIYHGDQTGWSDKEGYIDPLSIRLGTGPNPWAIHT